MPQKDDSLVVGHRVSLHANDEPFPSRPAPIAIYCRTHVPRDRAHSRQRRTRLFQKEATQKHLICCFCRSKLATGEQAPFLPDVAAQVLGGDAGNALWMRSQSWIVAASLQEWIHQGTIPEDLWVYTRLLLLESKSDARLIPTRVCLEVEVRFGKDLDRTLIRHFDVAVCAPDLLDLMGLFGCSSWGPLREGHPPRNWLSFREKRTLMAGISYDQVAREKMTQALTSAYGAFTLEWLCTAHVLFP